MKKLFLIISIFFIVFTARAQYYNYNFRPMCWDSASVNVQIIQVSYYVVGNTTARGLKYIGRDGLVRTPSDADLTEGYCTDLSILAKQDTIMTKSCVVLTRQMTNTADASVIYPRRELEKHTYTVGTEIVETKFYIPQTDSLVTSPVMAISVVGCSDFNSLDFGNMFYHGDTVLVSAGDTTTIDPSGGDFQTLTIVCDKDNMSTVKLIVDYLPISIDGVPTAVLGTNTSLLTTYANQYYQSWKYQLIDKFRLVAIGADCKCTYVASHEKNGF